MSWNAVHFGELTASQIVSKFSLIMECKDSLPYSQKPRQWTLFWARWMQYTFSQPITIRANLYALAKGTILTRASNRIPLPSLYRVPLLIELSWLRYVEREWGLRRQMVTFWNEKGTSGSPSVPSMATEWCERFIRRRPKRCDLHIMSYIYTLSISNTFFSMAL
jgi:hypothetical protein